MAIGSLEAAVRRFKTSLILVQRPRRLSRQFTKAGWSAPETFSYIANARVKDWFGRVKSLCCKYNNPRLVQDRTPVVSQPRRPSSSISQGWLKRRLLSVQFALGHV